MGDILHFDPQRLGRRHRASQALPSTATIIILPCVRYERLDEAAFGPCSKSGKSKSPRSRH
jgi:hypothetical protein